jgi:hypothetical protein
MRPLLALFAVILFTVHSSNANTRFYRGLDKFIVGSDVVAIVEVGPRDSNWGYRNPDIKARYRQLTEAKIKQLLKGTTPSNITILHGKELDDSLFGQGQGLYLVFLKHTLDGFVPFDGWPSSKEIKGDRVFGWRTHPYYRHDSGTPLEQVLSEIADNLRNRN